MYAVGIHLCISSADEAMTELNNSVRANEVDPKDFVALFVPGGHGTLSPFMKHKFLYCQERRHRWDRTHVCFLCIEYLLTEAS